MHWPGQLICHGGIHGLVAGNLPLAGEGITNHYHPEVRFRVRRHAVHMALVGDVQRDGRQGAFKFLLEDFGDCHVSSCVNVYYTGATRCTRNRHHAGLACLRCIPYTLAALCTRDGPCRKPTTFILPVTLQKEKPFARCDAGSARCSMREKPHWTNCSPARNSLSSATAAGMKRLNTSLPCGVPGRWPQSPLHPTAPQLCPLATPRNRRLISHRDNQQRQRYLWRQPARRYCSPMNVARHLVAPWTSPPSPLQPRVSVSALRNHRRRRHRTPLTSASRRLAPPFRGCHRQCRRPHPTPLHCASQTRTAICWRRVIDRMTHRPPHTLTTCR